LTERKLVYPPCFSPKNKEAMKALEEKAMRDLNMQQMINANEAPLQTQRPNPNSECSVYSEQRIVTAPNPAIPIGHEGKTVKIPMKPE
jgi:hypothetical protein